MKSTKLISRAENWLEHRYLWQEPLCMLCTSAALIMTITSWFGRNIFPEKFKQIKIIGEKEGFKKNKSFLLTFF